MAEVDIKRLGAGDGQEHRADRDEGHALVLDHQEVDAVVRIDRARTLRIVEQMCTSPETPIARNQTGVTGPNTHATLAVPKRCTGKQSAKDHQRHRHDIRARRPA